MNIKKLMPDAYLAKECGAISLRDHGFNSDCIQFTTYHLEDFRTAIIKDFVESLENPVAWTSPDRSVLHRVTSDTVYGSHTIPLYDLSEWRINDE